MIFFRFILFLFLTVDLVSTSSMFRLGTAIMRIYHQKMVDYRNEDCSLNVEDRRFIKRHQKKWRLMKITNERKNKKQPNFFGGFASFGKTEKSEKEKLKKILDTLAKDFLLNQSQFRQLHQIPKEAIMQFSGPNRSTEGSYTYGRWKPKYQKYYHEYMQIISEVSKKLVPKLLIDLGYKQTNTKPVIHYRLSDVPFCRHGCHHLPYYQFWDIALKKLENQGIDVSELLILTTFKHNNKYGILSEFYLKDFQDYLHQKGYKTTVHKGKVLEDFALMVQAPGLVSSCGIFSFIAGVSNPKNFICSFTGEEFPKKKNSYTPVELPSDSFMIPIRPLLHSDLNYSDTEMVFKELRKTVPFPNS